MRAKSSKQRCASSDGKIIYLRLNNQTLIILRKKRSRGVARKTEKKKAERESLELLASGCP